jgi:hypothetical protein
MAKRKDTLRSLESDLIRAMSGASEEEVAQVIQRVQDVGAEKPAQAAPQPTEVLPEVTAFREEQADALAASEAEAASIGADIAFQDVIQANIGDLAAGKISAITATGPVAIGKGDSGTRFTATDGTNFTNYENYLAYQEFLDGKRQARQSAWDVMFEEFTRYGLGALVEPLKGLISDPTVSPSEFTIRLRGTDAYKRRFAANQARIGKGLRALSEGEYLELEDEYQNVMRRYGLPQSYYTRGELGRQEGFEKFIEFDVSPVELEERIATAQNRVTNAPPEVMQSLRDFYGDTISNGDVLAYVLNPNQALSEIKRRVTAAEIGAGAAQAGLGTSRMRAEELQRFGITGEQARAGFQQIAGGVQRGGQLAAIYQETPYGQETAEQEIFGITGAPQARQRRQRIIRQEEAAFGGTTGITGGALARERAGQY